MNSGGLGGVVEIAGDADVDGAEVAVPLQPVRMRPEVATDTIAKRAARFTSSF